MVCFPGKVPSGLIDDTHLVSGLDFFPTLCDYAEIDPPKDLKGLSLRPLLENRSTSWRKYLHAQSKATGRMVVDDQYKFIRYYGSETIQLFDLKNDPWETTNLAYSSSHQDDCNRMATEIDRLEQTLDNVDLPDALMRRA